MVEVMSEKSSPCNCKRCPTIQVANRSDAEESSRRSGSAAARETQLHILIATKVHQSGRDDESSKSGKSWRIKRTVLKKVFRCLCRFSSIDGSRDRHGTYRVTTARSSTLNQTATTPEFLGDSSMVRNTSRCVHVSSHRYALVMQTRHGVAQRFSEDQRSISTFRRGAF